MSFFEEAVPPFPMFAEGFGEEGEELEDNEVGKDVTESSPKEGGGRVEMESEDAVWDGATEFNDGYHRHKEDGEFRGEESG